MTSFEPLRRFWGISYSQRVEPVVVAFLRSRLDSAPRVSYRVPPKSIGLKGIPHPPPCGPPSPLGRGGTARRWVRGLFADDAFVALDVCGTLDSDGALGSSIAALDRKPLMGWYALF